MTDRPTTAIGVSMREVAARGYDETRDALDRRWGGFLAATLPGVRWMPVPNLGAGAAAFADGWGLDGFILSGGDDVGATPERDATERTLLDLATSRRLAVFGVCRGLQMIQTHFGGVLRDCDRAAHVAARHPVRMDGGTLEVNSYHAKGVAEDALAPGLTAMAWSADGGVEGLRHRDLPIAAVMWHPEREPAVAAHDRALVRGLFGHSGDGGAP